MAKRKYEKLEPELVEQYKDLATEVNARLRELEKLSKKKGYEKVLKYSYARIQEDIKARGWKDKRVHKGKASLPKTNKELKGAINDLKNFLDKPTSTEEGIKKTYQKNADTFNEVTGGNFSWQDMKVFMNDSLWEQIYNTYGSATAMKAYATLMKGMPTKEKLKEIVEKEEVLTDDIVVQEAIDAIYEKLNSGHETVEWFD